MTRVAAIDCGTNSVRLLIAERGTGGATVDLRREMRIVRLGQDVDRTGRLRPDAIDRTRMALGEYRQFIADRGVERVRMVATSATRDAENRTEFFDMVRATLGIDAEVVSGQEEAQLSFLGAVAGLPDLVGDVVVADIGGGSTELVRGIVPIEDPRAPKIAACSLNIGAVRMTERYLHADPPTRVEVTGAQSEITTELRTAGREMDLVGATALVGVAGTVTTVAAIALGLRAYDSAAIHGSILTRAQITRTTEWLRGADHAQRAAVPVIHPGRVDVITAGALILELVLAAVDADQIVVSERDILDGIAASIL